MIVTEEEAGRLLRNRQMREAATPPDRPEGSIDVPLACFTIPGPPRNKKNNPRVTWPSIQKLGLRVGPRLVQGLKDWLFVVSSVAGRGDLAEVRSMLETGQGFYPVIRPSASYEKFARAARRELLTHLEIRRPLVPAETTLRVDATWYMAKGRPGVLDEPGLWEALFDVIEASGIIANDFWLMIGTGLRIWPPKGRNKAALAERQAWNPRTEVRIYPGEPRQFGESKGA